MVNANSFLGYDKNEDRQLIINPEEAETVKRIFREYLEGSSCKQIAQGLERDGVLTARGSKRWHDSCIKRILGNEKYMGDALLQKTYTADFLKKKRVRNNGDVPQYYVEDDHEPIIPKELFLKTQEEMSRRGKYVDCLGRNRAFSSMHCFSGLIYCSECGSLYRRIHWNNRGRKVHVWRCITRLENSTECSARTVNENALTNAFVIAVNKLIATNDSYIEVLQKNIATVIETADPDSGESIQARIDELQQQILEKSDRNEDFDAEAQEILRLRQQKENASPNDISSEDMERIRKQQTFITKMPSAILDFDESLVKHLLEKITVFENKLEFEFKSGITIVIEN